MRRHASLRHLFASAYLFVPHHQDYQRLASFWSKYPTLGEKDPRAKTHAVMKLGALLNRIRFLVENSYVTFGGEVFKQEIGIAMGLIPAVPRTVNGTGHTGPSEFCATSI